jgi:hypothetical protein
MPRRCSRCPRSEVERRQRTAPVAASHRTGAPAAHPGEQYLGDSVGSKHRTRTPENRKPTARSRDSPACEDGHSPVRLHQRAMNRGPVSTTFEQSDIGGSDRTAAARATRAGCCPLGWLRQPRVASPGRLRIRVYGRSCQIRVYGRDGLFVFLRVLRVNACPEARSENSGQRATVRFGFCFRGDGSGRRHGTPLAATRGGGQLNRR